VEAKRLEFAFAQPYLDKRTNLALTSARSLRADGCGQRAPDGRSTPPPGT
jgi:hypothetical protein